ncbi:MAG: hydantoinase/oxoprolinase family protein, partial [Thiolinea sp.]
MSAASSAFVQNSAAPQYRIAVDIGGTFTDTVLVDAGNRVIATAKTATTPGNPTQGALAGVHLAIADAGITLVDIGGFIHGTTLATNALIERRGAQVASITTAGFRDILEIAYERRYSQYDINIDKPDLIVPRERCFTIAERMSVRGEPLEPLNEATLDELVAQLQACGTEAVAICLLHAYVNPAHEQRLRALLLERMPELVVSLSSDVSPGAREFDRLCTTIANAYIQPLMTKYLQDFALTFAGEGLSCPILMMTAGGGMTTLETAARYPVRLVESGPAGGAILAAQVAAQCGESEVLSFDMGGTTAKLCLIDAYQPQTSNQFEIARAARFIKGSGMPVRIPVVEMIEIGAGGGSIAGVDALGRLTVGPKSAGSEPGPAAFGKGGEQPTVTDADVVLGLIDPDAFAEGRLRIERAAAQEALQCHIGAHNGLDAIQAAQGVSQIVDENMASAGRMHAVESGKDLSTRTMIAFGGNGPLHATRVARRAGVQRIVIPADPGVGSAVGFLSAPIAFEVVRSRYATLENLDVVQLNGFFDGMVAEAEAVVRAGAPQGELNYQRIAFMRYHGQGHEIEIALPPHTLTEADVPVLLAAFEAEYAQQFTRTVPGMTVEILNWAVKVSTKAAAVDPLETLNRQQQAQPSGSRSVLCDVSGLEVEAAVYERAALQPGDRLDGPALVIEPQTTTWVSADFTTQVDAVGNLVVERGELEASEECANTGVNDIHLKSQIPSVSPSSKGSALQQ